MTSTKKSLICKASLLTMAITLFGFSTPAKAEMSKEDVQKIVQEYLLGNPEIVVDALEKFRTLQEEKAEKEQTATIQKHGDYFKSDDSPFVGPKDAEITVVEFFDYNCGYCKRAFDDVQALIAANKDVKVVFQEMPILSPSSKTAAQWALAAQNQGKYFEYHAALMNFKGNKTESTLEKIGKDLGLDIAQLKKDAGSSAVKKNIEKATAVAREIGIQGTPAFIINDTLYRGYLGKDGMTQAIAAERKKLTQ